MGGIMAGAVMSLLLFLVLAFIFIGSIPLMVLFLAHPEWMVFSLIGMVILLILLKVANVLFGI